MTRKTVGYVELEWECPVCHTRNAGTRTTCVTCGSPQPKDVQFQTAAGAQVVQKGAIVERAQAGPDIHCAFCGARNPATAATCHQCGADLTQGTARAAGQALGGLKPAGAPSVCPNCGTENPSGATTCKSCGSALAAAPAAAPLRPAAQSAGGGFNMGWAIMIGVAVVAIAVFGFLFWGSQTEEQTLTAVDADWRTVVAVQRLVPVEHTAWSDEVPSGVRVERCRPEVRSISDTPVAGAEEVCSEPYVLDTGSGVGEVVQDCEYRIYDDYCSYLVEEWREVDSVVASGEGLGVAWPALNLAPGEREGRRIEEFTCTLRGDGETFTYSPRTLDEYEQCRPGARWVGEVDRFGNLTAARPR